jgi:hypothetical protein
MMRITQYPVGDKVEVEHLQRADEEGEASKEAGHGQPARRRRHHVIALVGLEQIAAGVEVRPRLARASRPLCFFFEKRKFIQSVIRETVISPGRMGRRAWGRAV